MLACAALAAACAGGSAPRRPLGPPFPIEALLEAFDTNGDGAIGRDELDARRETSFSLADLNADGFVTIAEINRATLNVAEIRPEGGRILDALAPPPVDPSAMDTNRDGAVSRQEYMAVPLQILVQLDADRDGRVTRRELQAEAQRRVEQAAAERGAR